MHCVDKKTTFMNRGADETIEYLDRQNVECPPVLFLGQIPTRKARLLLQMLRANYLRPGQPQNMQLLVTTCRSKFEINKSK